MKFSGSTDSWDSK